MNQQHIAVLTRTMSRVPSRRDVLRGLVGAGIGLGVLVGWPLGESEVEAKKKHKKKKKKSKPTFNAFGCLNVGQPCRGKSANCCSGICQGKKPKKGEKDKRTCVAHNAGFCTAEMDTCTVGGNVPCRPNCFCTLTTGNAGFCGRFSVLGGTDCRVCARDTDCQAEFGAGAACVVLESACAEICPTTGQTGCMIPCL